LCVGTLGGLLTYCISFQVSRRDRAIRLPCGTVLGMCVDPALVRNDVAQSILSALADPDGSGDSVGGRSASHPAPAPPLAVKLARVRAVIALGHDRAPLEIRTDELLAHMADGY
jgi:hypothetical protein